MKIFVVGLSHKTAPISIRDRVTLGAEELHTALDELKKSILNESLLLSTCNRTELYGLIDKKCAKETSAREIYESLFPDLDIDLEKYLYHYVAEDAVMHLFRVSAGLDSLAFGEPQISGQVKDAYRLAAKNSNTGPVLNRLFHKTFSVTKNIRTNTDIGVGTTSIGFAAVDMAQKIFDDLSHLRIMVIGAGETGTLTANHFKKRGANRFLIANRTFEKAENLALSLGGTAIRFNMIVSYLHEVDVVVTCVGADELIIKHDAVERVMKERKNRPLFFIDLGAPRDVEPSINTVYNVFVYNIDDLKEVVDANLAHRQNELGEAEKIIEKEVTDFFEWYTTIRVIPAIQMLKDRFEEIRRAELDANRNKLNGADLEQVDRLTRSIVKKLLKDPILHLKANADTQDGVNAAETLKKVFKLLDRSQGEANA